MTFWAFMRRYPAQHWPWYLSGLVALIITNYITTLIPLKVKDIINGLTQSANSLPNIQDPIIILIGLSLVLLVSRSLSRILIFFPGRFVEYNLRNDLVKHLMTLSPTYFRSQKMGDLISRLINDIQSLRLLSALGYLHIINTIMIYGLVLWQMIRISVPLTFWCLSPVPFVLIIVKMMAGKMYTYNEQTQVKLGGLTDFFVESIGNIQLLKTYKSDQAFKDRLAIDNAEYRDLNIALSGIRSTMFPFIGIISSLGLIILFLIGGRFIIQGQMLLGDFVAFSAYITLLAWPTASFAWIINIIQRGLVSLKRITAVLAETPDIQDSPLANPNNTLTTAPQIQIRDLTFAYEINHPILHDISLTIASGQSLGIFGKTGSGKSTLAQLITRCEVIPNNKLFLNELPIETYTLEESRKATSYVPQNPFLFSDTIAENIAYSNTSDTPHTETVITAAKRACVENDIHSFPNQYETIIGEKGIILSGGQKSRIALARAYYKAHHILVLDDVLSAVDNDTESELIKKMKIDKNPPTTIIVAHRLSALQHCDQIIVLENGRISAKGTHEELIKIPGIYQYTWQYQQLENTP
ncbi:ABC transporter ATP-binding protein [bacterium]|jgi:ATP-binding cassette, subfamily B, multidrug efflux pump|nr:ABC transporter ATP-binding protein [bacterium]